MRWPPDHPALTDPSLVPWAGEVDRLCPDALVVRVLRHLPGRRVTTLVALPDGAAVLKLFATSRARGGHRRLAAFGKTTAGRHLPRSLGHRKGHLLLVEFVPGVPLAELADHALPQAARLAGSALRAVHDSGVWLDRDWTAQREVDQLRRTAGPATREVVERAIRRWSPPAGQGLVPSHRDCHPAQVIHSDRGLRFVDLDDAAMAPRALDVGNFIAHVQMEATLGRREPTAVGEAVDAFLGGYGLRPEELEAWTRLSQARLAALAETRHGSLAQATRLSAALEDISAGVEPRSA